MRSREGLGEYLERRRGELRPSREDELEARRKRREEELGSLGEFLRQEGPQKEKEAVQSLLKEKREGLVRLERQGEKHGEDMDGAIRKLHNERIQQLQSEIEQLQGKLGM